MFRMEEPLGKQKQCDVLYFIMFVYKYTCKIVQNENIWQILTLQSIF